MIEIHKPKTAILKASGINCDQETKYAFDEAGSQAEIIHLNQLKNKEFNLKDFQIIVIPGGFSYGDNIASGRIMALELKTYFADELMRHKENGRVILGICNGFQVLVQTGLLPFGQITSLDKIKSSLEPNESGRFESRWVFLKPEESVCRLNQSLPFTLPIAHGEGKFVASNETVREIEKNGQVILRYCDLTGRQTMDYPFNPNGSIHAIAGICDPTGRIIGLMPHPERFVQKFHHPNWRRLSNIEPSGLQFIKNIINLVL